MKALTTRQIRKRKASSGAESLQMLTCYDFQTAKMLEQTSVDLILVGDSVGNVVLGYDTTVPVTIQDMITFGSAVRRGAKNKFLVVDLPFGATATFDDGIKNAVELFRATGAESLKIEGATDHVLSMIKRLSETGVAVMGHIGLTPQSVHELGGYFTHGKTTDSAHRLLAEAIKLEQAGAFAVVLECVDATTSAIITEKLNIPTIGIGSGDQVDGQVLVLNDLLGLAEDNTPKFVKPVANLFETKKTLIENYLKQSREVTKSRFSKNIPAQ
ncbi:MAG: 3-methyl-2-oxobutanoate hydroxymethyltransferase [Bdellovibrionales bacterium CG12_big_fil_rev_8_21_14_0_65_38_15]|nr:MAG: 3-methyl-2-oxobutanoate hydroxymethyltransferase [Bdellovibrionales bacterium CG22_combo_CG10-13_8_21_14_all_38_13]PIQ54744.1 MAG: 3-methyl-2-oxobutanoate hydroxymethyltransferase [Bdellovibrionales bacterium CG12_big_fil_rev_8_21_14_0_65_38_15]PIR31299.1 MAG: 3-methyl-2-oxobutanoate hydroxymethyltransferase [Bdellovibrionales bacterium CG11_big_fil_rev_8_21_14_0_20_38_13]